MIRIKSLKKIFLGLFLIIPMLHAEKKNEPKNLFIKPVEVAMLFSFSAARTFMVNAYFNSTKIYPLNVRGVWDVFECVHTMPLPAVGPWRLFNQAKKEIAYTKQMNKEIQYHIPKYAKDAFKAVVRSPRSLAFAALSLGLLDIAYMGIKIKQLYNRCLDTESL